jgi:preprotein translocase subunit SecG
MHTLLGQYWWVVLPVMAIIMIVFILVTGRKAGGGLAGQAKHGWSRWMALSQAAGNLLGRIVLTIFFFTFAAPFGLIRTRMADPLRLRKVNQPGTWLARETRDLTLDDARRQF